MHQPDTIGFYSTYDEAGRLFRGVSRFEYIRSKEIIARYLPDAPATIVDVGGAAGAYSFWLAGLGHQAHLIDLTPTHIETARAHAAEVDAGPASMQIGDACALPFPDDYADVALLMGPLYHLVEREARLAAIRECGRVLKPGGRIFCAAICRFASMLDGFVKRLFDDPVFKEIVDRDLREGQHRCPDGKPYFTAAYLHTPAELREEVTDAGLVCEKVLGVEGPWGILHGMNEWMDEEGRYYELALKYARAIEEEESLLGASCHLLAVARNR